MPFAYSLAAVTFSDGTRVQLPPRGVVLIVGPNNAGKSLCLREIVDAVGHAQDLRVVVTAVEDSRSGSVEDFASWLAARYRCEHGPGGLVAIRGVGFNIAGGVSTSIARRWHHSPNLGEYVFSLVTYLPTASRLSMAGPFESFDFVAGHPTEPAHELQRSAAVEGDVSKAFHSAFGVALVVDRAGGPALALRCGDAPDAPSLGGHFSFPYADAVRALPGLHDQGDGMKSFAACLLHADVVGRPVVLIDEPEAFLHPPQARTLARHLAKSAKPAKSVDARQVFLATHSGDVVRGALDGAGEDVTVIRLTRTGAINQARQVRPEDVKRLWNDPLLRASNLLDGLFHRAVVLCESDGDCRFYNAVVEAMSDAAGSPRPDVMFCNTGGKHRLPTAIAALRAAGVDVIAIADLDVLSEENLLSAIVEALGGEWSSLRPDWTIVRAAVEQAPEYPLVSDVRQRLTKALDTAKGDERLTDGLRKNLREALRPEGGWKRVKESGMSAIPKGQARSSADALVASLKSVRLFAVPVGELEGFLPRIGKHGPAWVEEALQVDLAAAEEARAAREFVKSLGLS